MPKALQSKHPKEMYLLALCEMCQRFAFWGVANLLVIYLVQTRRFTEGSADYLFGIFTGVAFALPLLGGYLADRIGYRLPIIWGSISTAIGCFLLATGSSAFLYLALFFTAIGASIFTPSIYAILGSIYGNRHHLRESGFSIYYAAVNLGVFIALITLGAIGQAGSWKTAFALAGVIQLLALLPFWKVIQSKIVEEFLSKRPHPIQKRENRSPFKKKEKDRILVICVIALFSIFFWLSYNQGGSSMSLFALKYTDRHLLSFSMPPSWLLSSESLYLVLLAFPLASFYLYLTRIGKNPSPPMKVALSLVAIGLCYTIMWIGASQIPDGARSGAISPFYLFSAYLLMAIGEMLICPIGLSLITHISPRRYTAFLVGAWYLCIGIAFYLGGIFASFMSKLRGLDEFFSIFMLISFLPAVLLLLLIKKLNKMRHVDSL
jgi:POT family proton-dependent oligopeptide transporter